MTQPVDDLPRAVIISSEKEPAGERVLAHQILATTVLRCRAAAAPGTKLRICAPTTIRIMLEIITSACDRPVHLSDVMVWIGAKCLFVRHSLCPSSVFHKALRYMLMLLYGLLQFFFTIFCKITKPIRSDTLVYHDRFNKSGLNKY